MRVKFRGLLLALVMSGTVGVLAPSAAQAAFGVEKFVAVNCSEGHEACGGETIGPYSFPKETDLGEAETEGFVLAGGHVPYGITDFSVKTEGTLPNAKPQGLLTEGPITHIRTDVATGLATSPTAVPQCDEAEFGATEALPESGFYAAPTCNPESIIGVNKVVVYAGEAGDVPIEGKAYNLVQKQGLASEFGVALKLPKELTKAILTKKFVEEGEPLKEVAGEEKAIEEAQYYSHTLIEGNVEWGKEEAGTNQGDYHDYFNITVSPALPLIASRLVFFGTTGAGNFITNATSCPGDNTSYVTLTSEAGVESRKAYTTPVGLEKCDEVPFEPGFTLAPASFLHDEPVALAATVSVPQYSEEEEINSSEVKDATFTLPEGMTLNPSAAAKLQACTPAQARIHSSTAGVECPAASQVGTVELEVPTLPAGSLKGDVYLGGPEKGSITGPPYIIYVDAESARYGVSVRLEGKVEPNLATGRLTTTFAANPAQPFTSIKLNFESPNGSAYDAIASPLACGTATATSTFAPYTELASATVPASFTVTGCASTLPFALSQETASTTYSAGANTEYTLTLKRATGEQYLNSVSTTLPPGLNGKIPAVAVCGSSLAASGACPAGSKIGTATVLAGAGTKPYAFSGPVYLTGPYEGAPYGLSIAVPAVAGPFNLGTIVTRATINIDPTTARITVASVLPTIVKGVPLRIQEVKVAVGAQKFLTNPTNCSAHAFETTLTSTLGTTQSLTSPFQVSNCSALAFKPVFAVKSQAKTSKANGASIETTVNQPAGGSNIASVLVQLPIQLPSRLTTLQKSCPEATFAANPYTCPAGSKVGGARANTPLLPEKMTGPAYLVSHAGLAFPDLDLVLEADGVRIILTGHTKITKGITTTNFQTVPDAPVSSITVNLPTGPNSALAANGSLCKKQLLMPTTITAQSGKVFKQTTKIKVPGCPVAITGARVIGDTAYVTAKTGSAGRLSGGGPGLQTVRRTLRAAHGAVTLKVPLSAAGRASGRPFSVRVRVGFVSSNRQFGNSTAYRTIVFG
jgi:hypothetical protein